MIILDQTKYYESAALVANRRLIFTFPFRSQGEPFEMFSPGFAQIGRLLDGETVARKSGVMVGDVIVAVNGAGFRRFASDFDDSEVTNLSEDSYIPNDNNVLHLGRGETYDALLTKIKTIKSAGSPPLVLSLERWVGLVDKPKILFHELH